MHNWRRWYLFGLCILGLVGVEFIQFSFEPPDKPQVSKEHCDLQARQICIANLDRTGKVASLKKPGVFCSCWLNGKGIEDNIYYLQYELDRAKKK
jgi:hypothetical protein